MTGVIVLKEPQVLLGRLCPLYFHDAQGDPKKKEQKIYNTDRQASIQTEKKGRTDGQTDRQTEHSPQVVVYMQWDLNWQLLYRLKDHVKYSFKSNLFNSIHSNDPP